MQLPFPPSSLTQEQASQPTLCSSSSSGLKSSDQHDLEALCQGGPSRRGSPQCLEEHSELAFQGLSWVSFTRRQPAFLLLVPHHVCHQSSSPPIPSGVNPEPAIGHQCLGKGAHPFAVSICKTDMILFVFLTPMEYRYKSFHKILSHTKNVFKL